MIDQDPVTPDQARLERVKQWRQVMLRGVAGQQFRTSVTEAYDYRCFFTGQRLPKTSVTASSGVDAAHILPWSSHNINSPSNGICLNKLCHWALDAGVLKLSFTNHKYVIEVPDRVRSVAGAERIDLGYFERIAGEVPADRLPKNPAFWPSPKYISDLNAFMFGRG
jgi:predicted restriction endonuclease